MEETEYIESRPQPKIALLTFGEYFKLNCELSIAKGYDLSQPTQRVFEMNPRAAKTAIQYDDDGNEISYTPKLVAEISSEIQINYPNVIAGIELFDSFIPTGEEVYEFVADLMESNVIDWTISQFVVVKGVGKQLTLYVNQTLFDSLTKEIKSGLNQLGLNLQVQE